jgi:uncharacterized metal-binding protein
MRLKDPNIKPIYFIGLFLVFFLIAIVWTLSSASFMCFSIPDQGWTTTAYNIFMGAFALVVFPLGLYGLMRLIEDLVESFEKRKERKRLEE